MSEDNFDPSSESKLEGNDLALIPSDPNERGPQMRMVSTSPQDGPRLPGSPKPDNGQPDRPALGLIAGERNVVSRVNPLLDADALALARQSFDSSVTYFNGTHRNRLLDAMSRFNSQHPKGSKYWSPAFEKRSRLFRPKTRATVRKREAAVAISLFGSENIVNVQATAGDGNSAQDARIQQALLNYRLRDDDRWYKFAIGAVQDADRQGFAIAKTYWDYEEANRYYSELHPQLGKIPRVDTVATIDRPGFALVPIENFHFAAAADWMDVVNASPFLIERIPMFLCDIRRYQANPNATLKYRNLTNAQLLSGGSQGAWDSITLQRERDVQSRFARNGETQDYAVCWVHRNILKINGEDYIFDSIGTTIMLSDMIPLSEFDPRGYRPYVVGSTLVEAHNPYNPGTVDLMAPMQDEINETANLRQDATKMATSGRLFVKRGTGLDLHALARFSPGQTVEMDNPNTDVKWDRAPEAPAGSFEENQLLNTELDDLVGNFSQASVAHNRNLNETVGGMQMLGDSANQMTEYDLHTLCTTFLSKVLQQVLDLEKQWETDKNLAAIIGSKLAVNARQFWSALDTESRVIVDVGFGATNPGKRIERITLGLQTLGEFFPTLLMQADPTEIARDVFAAVGQSDITRYFPSMDTQGQDPDPKVRALQAQVQQLMQLTYPQQVQLQIAQLKVQADQQKTQLQGVTAKDLKTMELQLAWVELQLESQKNDIARGQLLLAREQLSNNITMQRMEFQLQQATAMASANPPQITPVDNPKADQLNQPGSNTVVNQPPFSQIAATAGQYAQGADE